MEIVLSTRKRPPGKEGGRANVYTLAACQCLFTCGISIDLALTGLTGFRLAPDKTLSTLPFALITVVGALGTLGASFGMSRIGMRLSFIIGAGTGALGGAVSAWAVFHGSFWIFCVGTGAVGVSQALAQYYRLAAADSVASDWKGWAITTVLTGGMVAAVLGPVIAGQSKDLFPTALFAGSYLMVALLGAVSVVVLIAFYRDSIPHSHAAPFDCALPARPLAAIISQRLFICSLTNSCVGWVVMIFLMTASPIAAVSCHHTIEDGVGIIQWHLVGMFAPSYFVGYLIKRLGIFAVVLVGMLLNAACIVIGMTSTSLFAFYVGLLCLGVGWNFMFVGGSAMLVQVYSAGESIKTQAVSEGVRSIMSAVATLLAGPVVAHFSWGTVNCAMLPFLVICLGVTASCWRPRKLHESGRVANVAQKSDHEVKEQS